MAYLVARKLEICIKLSFMDRLNFINTFQFDHNPVLNNHIHPEPIVQRYVFVPNWRDFLTLNIQTNFC